MSFHNRLEDYTRHCKYEQPRVAEQVLFKGNAQLLDGVIGHNGLLSMKPRKEEPYPFVNRVFVLTYNLNDETTEDSAVSILLNTELYQSNNGNELIDETKPTAFVWGNGYSQHARGYMHIPDTDFCRKAINSVQYFASPEGYHGLYTPITGRNIFREEPHLTLPTCAIGINKIPLDGDKEIYPYLNFHLNDGSSLLLHSDLSRNWIQ
ncbi:hypothetical protein BH09PAT2_BH09PAT2_06330 [soil metagenome]